MWDLARRRRKAKNMLLSRKLSCESDGGFNKHFRICIFVFETLSHLNYCKVTFKNSQIHSRACGSGRMCGAYWMLIATPHSWWETSDWAPFVQLKSRIKYKHQDLCIAATTFRTNQDDTHTASGGCVDIQVLGLLWQHKRLVELLNHSCQDFIPIN